MRQKIFSGIIVALLAMATILLPFGSVKALTAMKVEPSESIFYMDTMAFGDRFNISVWVYDVVDLFAYQILMSTNETLLNITKAWLPTWDPEWVFYGQISVRPPPSFRDNNDNNVTDAVLIGDSLFMGTPFDGDGLLAIIELAIMSEPTENQVSCVLDIEHVDTYLLDNSLVEIPVLRENGYYELWKAGYRHDVAVTDIIPWTATIGHGLTLGINITVENQGDFAETFNVTMYVNETQIQRFQVENLMNRTSTLLTCMWDTQPFTRGNYTLSAAADVVLNETDILDNSFVDGMVEVVFTIHSILWMATSPPPYIPSATPRVDEPVQIEVNITDPDVTSVNLKYRKQQQSWFNTSMTFNATESLWIQTIPGTVENCTIEFFIEVQDGFGLTHTSSLLSYYVKALLPGDLNGDGKVDIWDIGYVAKHFGDVES